MYLFAFVMFWTMAFTASLDIAQLLLSIPIEAKPSSALLYLFTGFLWYYWSYRKVLSDLACVFPLIAAASVLLLKWDSHLFHLTLDIGWMAVWFNLARGHVWPWGGPWSIMFVSDAVINDAIDLLDHEQKTKGT
jgi:hypothetical protein